MQSRQELEQARRQIGLYNLRICDTALAPDIIHICHIVSGGYYFGTITVAVITFGFSANRHKVFRFIDLISSAR
jgi:hypothetical protein